MIHFFLWSPPDAPTPASGIFSAWWQAQGNAPLPA
jgi:hypothetical protein